MTVFDDALETLVNDANLGVDVLYYPFVPSGVGEFAVGEWSIGGTDTPPITCRGIFTESDAEPMLGSTLRLRDRQRALMLRAVDVPEPRKDHRVLIENVLYRVIDVSARHPRRLSWRLELALVSDSSVGGFVVGKSQIGSSEP